MRFEPLSGFLRLELHLARLARSAAALGFPLDIAAARQTIEAIAQGDEPLRVRLTLSPDGVIATSATPFIPLPPKTIWRLAVAETRLHHDDPLLRHKTTRRALYVAAREEFSTDEVDEVILLNEQDQVCEGTITSLFLDKGESACATPSLSCGLLEGVLRQELLANNVVRENIVTIADLHKARHIFVGNSLRGMVRAELVRP